MKQIPIKRHLISGCLSLFALGGFLPMAYEAEELSPEAAQAYLEIVNGYTAQYGSSSPIPENNFVYRPDVGLAQSRLVDLTADGQLDLLVFYVDSTAPEMQTQLEDAYSCKLEIWTFDAGQAQQIYKVSPVEPQESTQTSYQYKLVNLGDRWVIFLEDHLNHLRFSSSGLSLLEFPQNNLATTELFASDHHVDDQNFEANFKQATTDRQAIVSQYDAKETLQIADISSSMTCTLDNMPVVSCVAELEAFANPPEPAPEPTPEAAVPVETVTPDSQHAVKASATAGRMAQNYLDVLEDIKSKNGVSNGSSTGLAASLLLDLDGNGTQELLVTYCTKADHLSTLVVEIWTSVGEKAVLAYQNTVDQNWHMQNSLGDWRDVLSIHPHEGGWIFYYAGGGGQSEYRSYNSIFSYKSGRFAELYEDSLTKYTSSSGSVSYSGESGGNYYFGSDPSLSKSLPELYAGFLAMNEKYLQDSGVELFYICETGATFGIMSCESALQEMVAQESGNNTEPEVVIPTEEVDSTRKMAEAYQEILDGYIAKYGISGGTGKGVTQSYLLDFTGDGVPELVVGYCTNNTLANVTDYSAYNDYNNLPYVAYELEIWQMQDEKAIQIFQESWKNELFQPDGWTGSYHFVQVDGVWMLYEKDLLGIDITNEAYRLLKYENGDFQVAESIEYYSGGDGTSWKVNGANASEQNFEQVFLRFQAFSQSNDGIFAYQYPSRWGISSVLPALSMVLSAPEASDHFFGYPVVFDADLKASLQTSLPDGEVLAIYAVDEGLYYVILSVNGVQEGRLAGEISDNTWEILHSDKQNFSYATLEAQKSTVLSVKETEPEETEKQEESSVNSENSSSSSIIPVFFAGMFGAIIGVVLTQKSKKKE